MPQTERVLLVEADNISNQLLSFSLQREGFYVTEALTGPDGLRLAKEQPVDIILSEVLLPDMDGYEMCRQLRANWNTRRIPIVLVTSLGGTENRIQGLLAGADDYLMKPYDVRELMIRLRRLISTYTNCAQVNPITRLPGSQLIGAYFQETCAGSDKQPWALVRFDINRLRAFNQIYGYEAGDGVIEAVGGLLREVVHKNSSDGFLGHEGADDFVALVRPETAEAVCKEAIRRFDAEVSDYYPAEHRDNTYHVLIDRAGRTEMVPRLSLSIGVVTSDLCED